LHKIILDKSGKPVDYEFVEANSAFERLTGLKREGIAGKRATEVIPGLAEDPADWIGKYSKVALTGDSIEFESYSEPLKKWFSISAYSPKNGYFATIFDDITERKNVEEKLLAALKSTTEALIEKDKFFSIIAHDLKSPFNGILGFLNMLNDDYSALSDEERKKFILSVLKSSKKVYSLLEQMLEWRSLHGGKLDGPTIKINVRSLADDATSPLLSAMEKKRIKFQTNMDGAMVSAQEIMLERVIANLVSNAIKFTPSDGKGVVSISAAKTWNGFVQITVSDNGKGIPEEIMPLMFTNTAVTTSGTDGETGTGLGLPMVKTMVEKMGGKIWVETKVASKDDPASGSKFHFTLPSAQG